MRAFFCATRLPQLRTLARFCSIAQQPPCQASQSSATSLAAASPGTISDCGKRLLADLRQRYAAGTAPGPHVDVRVSAAFAAFADCALSPGDAESLRRFFESEADGWRFCGLPGPVDATQRATTLWFSRAMRLLLAVARSRQGQQTPLFNSLAEYALGTEAINTCPSAMLALANAAALVAAGSSKSARYDPLVHGALSRLMDTALPNELRAMSAVVPRLLAAHPHKSLYERWRRLSAGDEGSSSSSGRVASSSATSPSQFQNPSLIARYGTDAELLQLYADAEAKWKACWNHAQLGRQTWPGLRDEFLESLAASDRLRSADDLRRWVLAPLRDREGLALGPGATERLLELLARFAGGDWTARTVELSKVSLDASTGDRLCPACGGHLSRGLYLPEPTRADTDALLAKVRSLLDAEGGHRNNLAGPGLAVAHTRWLAQTVRGQLDLVVDGSNLILHKGSLLESRLEYSKQRSLAKLKAAVSFVRGQRRHSQHQKQQSLKASSQLSPQPFRVAVLVKRTRSHHASVKALHACLDELRATHPGVETALFCAADADDLLTLISALKSGPDCYILSNDTFKDHSFQLGCREAFVQWQLERQIFYPKYVPGVFLPLGSPCRSDVPMDRELLTSRPMHLLIAASETAGKNDASSAADEPSSDMSGGPCSLTPSLDWLCLRPARVS